MMFGLPLFSTALWMEENTSYQFGLEVIDDFIYDPNEFNFVWDHYIDYHEDIETPLIYLEVDNIRT